MPKTVTDLVRHALSGHTMGTRWSTVFFAEPGLDAAPVRTALQKAVDEVDGQMSTWKPDSDLMQFNRAPVGEWFSVPEQLIAVLRLGGQIGRSSGGAFDIGLGDAVQAWGFGAEDASTERIRAAMSEARRPAHEILEFEGCRVRKHGPVRFDLNGIAKGYGVDRLAETLESFGIRAGLAGIDGEMRGLGMKPDGEPWSIAIEEPDPDRRAPHSIVTLQVASVATSGDYRHWIEVGSRRLSHTMDPRRGRPLTHSPASVTVVSRSCAEADAWATALMVLGLDEGTDLAERLNLDALFLVRTEGGALSAQPIGKLFSAELTVPVAA